MILVFDVCRLVVLSRVFVVEFIWFWFRVCVSV